MQHPFYIDFHCHPSLKPFGKSFPDSPGVNSDDSEDINSVWHQSGISLSSGILQDLLGIARFTQSDFYTLVQGNCKLICASLYPIEKGFFNNKLGDGGLSRVASSFITKVGEERVRDIQHINDYFADLKKEYAFYKQLNNTTVTIDGEDYLYKIVKNYAEVTQYLKDKPGTENVVFVIITIEGMHVLNSDLSAPANEQSFKRNLMEVKNWEHPPFFITFCHHFNNFLCGHAKSLFDTVGSVTDQQSGLDEPFQSLGWTMLRAMLDDSGGQKRIYPDIKHMSIAGRIEYYKFIEDEFNGKVPIIVSHGAANGMRSHAEPVIDARLGNTFFDEDINLFDDEILILARSGGIMGLQLDEHRIASKEAIADIAGATGVEKKTLRSKLLWNQIQYVAELLDGVNLPAWDCVVIGSDSDGIINPINGFLTLESLPELYEYLKAHANNYLRSKRGGYLNDYNKLTAKEIMDKVFYKNGAAFLEQWFV